MKEALKLALEALERYQIKRQDFERFADVITAIKEALAQPEQERLAPTCERCADEIVENNAGLCANCLPAICTEQEPVFKWCSVFQEMPTEDSHLLFCFGVHVVEGSYTRNYGWASLAYGETQPDFWAYMPPPPHHKRNQELYAIPPQRPWVGLTDEELDKIYETHHNQYGECETPNFGYERAIEAKLKEKNT